MVNWDSARAVPENRGGGAIGQVTATAGKDPLQYIEPIGIPPKRC